MVFSSLIFIYAFLPLSLLFYALAKSTPAKNAVLLIFSLVFYAWGEPTYVLILVFMTFCDWGAALLIQNKAQTARAKRLYMIAAAAVNIGLIGFFKYTGFFLINLKAVFGIPDIIPQIALPIGISFYTFQLLSYVADVYRGTVEAQKSFFNLLLYSSLFYQCIAGPIVRYSDINNEINSRTTNLAQVCDGITRFTVGLSKKALVANTCGLLCDSLLIPAELMNSTESFKTAVTELSGRSAVGIWFGVLFYTLQIYLDFSAYSDMAIGMGRMVGFHFKENFNYPYMSVSVTDFWRRWHISLSTFFRDYVYIPLGGNRKGRLKTYRNLFVVWLLTGLWHGASWNYVLWGLYFFVFLVIEKAGLLKLLERIPSFVGRIYSLAVVFFGWILFRFENFSFIPVVLRSMFCLNGNPVLDFETKTLLLKNTVFIIIALVSVTPLVSGLAKRLEKKCEGKKTRLIYNAAGIAAPAVLLLLSTLALVGDSYNPFLYFQF